MASNSLSIVVYSSILIISACGSSGEGEKNSSSASFPKVDGLESGITMVLEPFREEGDNVLLMSRGSETKMESRLVLTIPGVHWSWAGSAPKNVAMRKAGGKSWKISKYKIETALPESDFDIKYEDHFAYDSWPVVNGTRGSDGGVIMLGSILKAWPTAKDQRLRLYFFDGKKAVPVRGGSSCGSNCIDFSGLVEAMETPVTYYRSESSVCEIGSSDEFPWYVHLIGLTNAEKSASMATIAEVREKVFAAWKTLGSRWGVLPPGDGFAVHLLVQDDCSFQGLEHAAGTLLQTGYCGGTSFGSRLLKLALHEIIHTWNGRYLYPAETASWSPLAFSEERLKQLYFYEGVTEGFARLYLSETESSLREGLVGSWNSTISSLASFGLGATLADISTKNYSLAYEAGALLLLRLAAETRIEFGETEAKSRIWGILPAIAQDTVAGPFSFASTLWAQRCFASGIFAPCAGVASGYSAERLPLILANRLGLSNWETSMQSMFTGQFLPTLSDLNGVVSRVGAATGVGVGLDSSGRRLFSVPTLSVNGNWPL